MVNNLAFTLTPDSMITFGHATSSMLLALFTYGQDEQAMLASQHIFELGFILSAVHL